MILDNSGQPMAGAHNNSPDSIERVRRSNTYQDLSTVWVTPSPDGKLDCQTVFQSWLSLAMPMNQKVCRLGIAHAEVAEAYEAAVEMALKDEVKWKYLLTVEHDNLPPRDGLLKLYESIIEYDVVGGLYWMKGENGTAHIYGNPSEDKDSYRPQVPLEETIQPCNALGMGFTLFNLDIFRTLPQPWFKTSGAEEAARDEEFTQDIHFFRKAAEAGFKFAVDTRVKVGHLDFVTRKIW